MINIIFVCVVFLCAASRGSAAELGAPGVNSLDPKMSRPRLQKKFPSSGETPKGIPAKPSSEISRVLAQYHKGKLSESNARSVLTPLVRWQEERKFYGKIIPGPSNGGKKYSRKVEKTIDRLINDAVERRVEGLLQASVESEDAVSAEKSQ